MVHYVYSLRNPKYLASDAIKNICAITPPHPTSLSPRSFLKTTECRKRIKANHLGTSQKSETPPPDKFQFLLKPIPKESVSEFARRTAATVDTKTMGKDNVARLIVFDSMANTLKPAKLHYSQICQIVNSYQERSDERHLRECIRRYKIANQNLRLFVFKWGLKKLGLMQDFKTMTGPNNLYHDSNGRKYQEMGQAMNNRNYFQEGNRRLKLDLPYEPYYSEIWGKVSAVSRLIFPFSTMDFCWH